MRSSNGSKKLKPTRSRPNPTGVLVGAGLCLALVTLATSAAAEEAETLTVAGLLARFAELDGLEARFHEEKQIALLDAPLTSEGRLLFAGGDAPVLLRRIESPSASTVLISGERLAFHDGRRRRELDLDGAAGALVRNFVQSFLFLLAGDEAALRRLYTINLDPREGDDAWQLTLAPRQASMRRVLAQVRLRGHGVLLEQMEVVETSGDRTTTTFSDVNASRSFSDAERQRIFRLP